MSERENAIRSIVELIELVNAVESKTKDVSKAEQAMDNANEFVSTKLADFDEENLERYVNEKLGDPPTKPTGLIVLAGPVYASKLLTYKADMEKYNKDYAAFEEEYYFEYSDIRDKLKIEDEKITQDVIDKASKKLVEKKDLLANCKIELENNDYLGEDLKSKNSLNNLKNILVNHRADTIKEAVNILYDDMRAEDSKIREEKYREKILNIENEILDQVKNMVEKASRTENYAESACNYSSGAASELKDISNEIDNLKYDFDDFGRSINEIKDKLNIY